MSQVYVVRHGELYVDHIGENSVELVKNVPSYGLTPSLRYAEKQRKLLKELLGVVGEILVKEVSVTKKEILASEVEDVEDSNQKYYILENDKMQAVKSIEDTGCIELSFQQQYKMTRDYQVERALERLSEYGLEGYKLKEVIVKTELKKLKVDKDKV